MVDVSVVVDGFSAALVVDVSGTFVVIVDVPVVEDISGTVVAIGGRRCCCRWFLLH